MFVSLLLIGVIVYNLYQRLYWKPDFENIRLEYGEEIIEFTRKQTAVKERSYNENPWLPEKNSYFKFDPNKLDSAGWVKLGFSPKQSASIINYRNAGAVFRKPKDIKKLFVVDNEKYEALLPFIQIEEVENERPKEQTKKFPMYEKREVPKPKPIIVELNAADTAELKKLYGIGSSFAKRIVKYRELLGGYMSKEQLLEVYGMDTVRYSPISENLVVDTTIRNRININTADFKTLLRHPYLNKNQVKAIVNYRKQHGDFNSISDLQKIHLISKETFNRIAPYFRVK